MGPLKGSVGFPGGTSSKERLLMQKASETWVRSHGFSPLEEGMATHSSILAWRVPWTEKPGGATVHRVSKSRT